MQRRSVFWCLHAGSSALRRGRRRIATHTLPPPFSEERRREGAITCDPQTQESLGDQGQINVENITQIAELVHVIAVDDGQMMPEVLRRAPELIAVG